MSLKRYKTEKGFKELVNLIETSPLQSQVSMLAKIELEDKEFAQKVKESLFFFEDFFYQTQDTILFVTKNIKADLWAKALYAFDRSKIQDFLDKTYPIVKKSIEKELNELKETNFDPKNSIPIQKKIIKEVREFEDKELIKLIKKANSTLIDQFNIRSDEMKYQYQESQPKVNTTNIDQINQPSSLEKKKIPIIPPISTLADKEEKKIENAILEKAFVSIHLDDLDIKRNLLFDLYVYENGKFRLYKAIGHKIEKTEFMHMRSKYPYVFITFSDFKKNYIAQVYNIKVP